MECSTCIAVEYVKTYSDHLTVSFLSRKNKTLKKNPTPLRVFLYYNKIQLTLRGLSRVTFFLLLYMTDTSFSKTTGLPALSGGFSFQPT